MKKVEKTTRPFRYDLNQIPYDYTVEVRNRFKVPGASVRSPARDKVMRKEADIRKVCSDFRDPSGNS